MDIKCYKFEASLAWQSIRIEMKMRMQQDTNASNTTRICMECAKMKKKMPKQKAKTLNFRTVQREIDQKPNQRQEEEK